MKIILILFLAILFNPKVSKAELLELEKRIIKIYQENVPSVVSVANLKIAKNFWYGEEVEVPQGAGTGFVWDSNGHIVTNFHVVNGGNSFVVTFQGDPTQYKASLVGASPKNDIAVLKLTKMKSNIKKLQLGSSQDLRVGQLALAIGNPFGFDHSISRGIVSALGRKMDGVGGVKIHDMVQTDAAINQGNSGGPLLDSSGRVIGVNTLIVSGSGSSAGLGFAVPIDTVKRVVPELIKFGKVIRPGLGISVLDDFVRDRYVGKKGVALSYVDPEGSAGRAGLKGMMRDRFGRVFLGDIILAIDSYEVNSRDDIYHALGKYKIGDTVTLHYIREQKKLTTKVKLKAL